MGACCTTPKHNRSSRSNSPGYGAVLEDNQNEETPLFAEGGLTGRIRIEGVDAAQPERASVAPKFELKTETKPGGEKVEVVKDLLRAHKLPSTKAALRGKLSGIKRTKLPKIYICLIGLDDDSKHERDAVEKFLQEKVNIFENKSIEMVVLNVNLEFIYPDGQTALEVLENFLKGEVGKSTICRIVFINECLGWLVPPTFILKWDFDEILSATDSQNAQILTQNYENDPLKSPSTVRLKMKHIQLSAKGTKEEYIGIVDGISAQYYNLVPIVSSLMTNALKDKYIRTLMERLMDSNNDYIFENRTLMVNRRIKNKPGKDDPNYSKYFSPDEDLEILNFVKAKFSSLANRDQIFDFETMWEKIEDFDDYLHPLCLRLYEYLQKNICGKPQECKMNIRSSVEDGVTNPLFEELLCHAEHCQILSAEPQDSDDELIRIREYLTNDNLGYLVLTAGTDFLLSNVMASAIARCEEWRPDAFCIFRFVNLTTASSMLEGLFHTLCEQLKLIFPHDKLRMRRGLYMKNFSRLLGCASEKYPVIIFLDGISNLPTRSFHQIFVELPELLPPSVKIVLSGSLRVQLALTSVQIIKVREMEVLPKYNPNRTSDSTDQNESSDLNDSTDQNTLQTEDDENKETKNPNKLFCTRGLKILNRCLRKSNTSQRVESVMRQITHEIEDEFLKPAVHDLLVCLTLSKIGLTDHEGIRIFEQQYGKTTLAVMEYIRFMGILRTILRFTVQNGIRLFTWIHEYYGISIEKIYLENIDNLYFVNYLRENIMQFNNFSVDRIRFNPRVLQIRNVQDGNSLEIIHNRNSLMLMDHVWLMFTLERCGPFQILKDINFELVLTEERNEETYYLKEFFVLSAFALEYEPKQFYAQICARLYWLKESHGNICPRICRLVDYAENPPISTLQSSSQTFSNTLNSAENYFPEDLADGVFRIPDNSSHVVTLSSSKGEVFVWKLVTNKPVRSMVGLNNPRNFKMIDSEKCLLLCGRELRVYNLNSGKLLTKLRELMNQKSPFFGLYDKDHVVTLSRSRMYVNMTNIITDKCDTTFKVGEDRFLNSLIVSGNGKICVCGDESKKPNSILVWNLETRKLLYDLKMTNHDFNTLIMAITYAGNFLCCVSDEIDDSGPNFVIVYDLRSGTVFRRLKPGPNTTSLAISFESSCVIVGLENCSIMAWDLKSGTTRWAVFGHSAPVDTLKIDNAGRYLLSWDSTGKDESIRFWGMETGELLGTITPDQRITACDLSNEGDRIFITLDGENEPHCFEFTHACLLFREDDFGSPEYDEKVFDLGQAQASQ